MQQYAGRMPVVPISVVGLARLDLAAVPSAYRASATAQTLRHILCGRANDGYW